MVVSDKTDAYVGGHSGEHVSCETEEGEGTQVKEIRSPSKFLVGLEVLVPKVLQTAPIAMIQVADFVTDILVVLQLFEMGEHATAMIAAGCVGCSMVPVILGSAMAAISEFTEGHRRNGFIMVLVGLLGPINLHTLVLGLEHAVSSAQFQVLKRGSEALAALKAAQIAKLEAKWQKERVVNKHEKPLERMQNNVEVLDGDIGKLRNNLNVRWKKQDHAQLEKNIQKLQGELAAIQHDKSPSLKLITDKIKEMEKMQDNEKKKQTTFREAPDSKDDDEEKARKDAKILLWWDKEIAKQREKLCKTRESDMSQKKKAIDQAKMKLATERKKDEEREEDLRVNKSIWEGELNQKEGERKAINKEIRARKSEMSEAMEKFQQQTDAFEEAARIMEETEPELLARKVWTERIHILFMLSKAMESGMESLPLAVLSASVLISNNIEDNDYVLFASSMVLSVLSMAYGFFGPCLVLQTERSDDSELEENNKMAPLRGRKLRIFLAILVNISWAVFAMALCYGTAQLGAWRYLLPAAHFLQLFFVVAVGLAAPVWGSGNICFSGLVLFILLPALSLFVGSSVCASLIGAGTDLWRLIVPFDQREKRIEEIFEKLLRPTDGLDLTSSQRESLRVAVFDFSPLLRRLSLCAMAIAALASAITPPLAVLSALGALADLTASFYLSSIFDHEMKQQQARELEQPGSNDENSQVSGQIGILVSAEGEKGTGRTEDGGRANLELARDTDASPASIREDHDASIKIEAGGVLGAGDVVQESGYGVRERPTSQGGDGGLVREREGIETSESDSDAAEQNSLRLAGEIPHFVPSDSDDRPVRMTLPTPITMTTNFESGGFEAGRGGGSVARLGEGGREREQPPLSAGDEERGPGEHASVAGAVTAWQPAWIDETIISKQAAMASESVLLELDLILQGLMCSAEPEVEERDLNPRPKRANRTTRASRYAQAEDDYLNAMSWHIEVALALADSASQDAASSPPAHAEIESQSPKVRLLCEVRQQIAELQSKFTNAEVKVSAETQRAIKDAVKAYMPKAKDADVSSEEGLLNALKKLQSDGFLHEAPKAESEMTPEPKITPQPLHVTNLHFALLTQTWATVPSFFQKVSENCNFTQSYRAETCGYFISHSWQDNGLRKLAMLREFLFAHSFLGRICVVLPLLACFLLSTGFCLHSRWHWFPPLLLSGATLFLLAVLLLWYWFSILGLCPSSMTPWMFSTTTVWIDKLCIDQTNDETKMKGVASFKEVLNHSDRMVALISATYFERMWCVYELAVFAQKKTDKLLLLSLDWPSSLSPFKSVDLTDEEEQMLKTFTCKKAKCFVPADRVKVLDEIREDFGSEEKFDEFVHTELLEVFRASKRLYFTSVTTAGKEALDLAFGN